jgi:putative acetyltransferase
MQTTIPLRIRPEHDSATEREAIGNVNRLVFGGEDEAKLVEALRAGGYQRLSLVAERDGVLVGHILFSELSIMTDKGRLAGLSLAPMAVLPGYQRQGIGSQLLEQGLAGCREQGHAIVIVLGHPEFYPRFGFSAELAVPLESPYSGDAWMALELKPGALRGVKGTVVYPPPFAGL